LEWVLQVGIVPLAAESPSQGDGRLSCIRRTTRGTNYALSAAARIASSRSTSRRRSLAVAGRLSGSALAADGPAERVAKGVSGVLRPHQCCRGNFGIGPTAFFRQRDGFSWKLFSNRPFLCRAAVCRILRRHLVWTGSRCSFPGKINGAVIVNERK